jgi:hypothetical protein
VLDACSGCLRRRVLNYVARHWLCRECWPKLTDEPWPGGERL